jgi:hypothetical protein
MVDLNRRLWQVLSKPVELLIDRKIAANRVEIDGCEKQSGKKDCRLFEDC